MKNSILSKILIAGTTAMVLSTNASASSIGSMLDNIKASSKTCKVEAMKGANGNKNKCLGYIFHSEQFIKKYPNHNLVNVVKTDLINIAYYYSYGICAKQYDMKCMDILVEDSTKYGLKGGFPQSDLRDIFLGKKSYKNGRIVSN